MARFSAANYTNPAFTYATADSDVFADTDLQSFAQAMDVHDHTTGNGKQIPSGGIANLAITTALLAANAVTLAKMDLGAWGVLARSNGMIVVPEGTVSDNGSGALVLGSTLIIINPITGTWVRVASGTYNLGSDGYLYVDLPATGAERATLTPTVGVWADADVALPNTDRILLAFRQATGAIYTTWGQPAAFAVGAGAVGTTQLADNSVTSAKIVDGAIATADIGASQITGALVAANAITHDKTSLSNASGTYGGGAITSVDPTYTDIASVTVTPTATTNVVLFAGLVGDVTNQNANRLEVRLYDATGPAQIKVIDQLLDVNSRFSFDLSFLVTGVPAGTRTYKLQCTWVARVADTFTPITNAAFTYLKAILAS